MLYLSAEVFITFALLTLQVDFFYPHFTEGKLRHGAEYMSPLRGQRCLVAELGSCKRRLPAAMIRSMHPNSG